MYVLGRIWQLKDNNEFDGIDAVGCYYTKKSAIKALEEQIKKTRARGYYISEEYYPKPHDKRLHVEVWMASKDDIEIIFIRETHEIV